MPKTKTKAKLKKKEQPTRGKAQKKKVPLVIKILGIFLAGLIGAVSGVYSYQIVGTQFIFIRSAILFITGILSFLLAYGLWKGSRWSWWFGVVISLALVFATLISFNITDLFIGLLLFCGLTQSKTRTYFHLEAQSAVEYLVSYSWAIVLICIAVSLLYIYVLPIPAQVVPSLCNFVNGVYCNDVVVFNTTQNGNTLTFATVIINSNQYPILSPKIYTSYQGRNSTTFSCTPSTEIAAGASALCIASLPVSGAGVSTLVGGNIYLNAQECTSESCSQTLNETYTGSFTSHVQVPTNPQGFSFTFTPETYIPFINSSDQLSAAIQLFGLPLKDAEVNFATNNSAYTISNVTLTGINGVAGASLHGATSGNVAVTATYLGISNTVIVYYHSGVTTTTTTTTSIYTTVPQTPELMLNMSPSNASNYWGLCTVYEPASNSANTIKTCVGDYDGNPTTSSNTIVVQRNSTIITICTNYPSTTGNYQFANWSQEAGVSSYNEGECQYGLDVPVIAPYYIGADYKLQVANAPEVPLTVSIASSNVPATAANWSVLVAYTLGGTSSSETIALGNYFGGANPVSNTLYVPENSTITSACVRQFGASNYGFLDWTGSYASTTGCTYSLDIPINSAYTINANFGIINNAALNIPLTLEMNPAGADNNWGACVEYTLGGFNWPEPEECVGNVLGFSGYENVIEVNANTLLQYICTYNNTLGPGNYGFTSWTGGYTGAGACQYGSGKITKAHTLLASYNALTSNAATVPITLNESPANASNYWDVCVEYSPKGFSYSEPEECVGKGYGFTGSVNTINVSINSTITYICLFNNTLGTGGYAFFNWSGNYKSIAYGDQCNYNLHIPVNTPYLIQANFTGGGNPYSSTSTTTSSTTSASTSSTTTIATLYSLLMECSGPVYTNCGISPTGGLSYDYPAGSRVSISAPSSTSSSSSCSLGDASFVGWVGTGGSYTGNAISANIVINTNMQETAYYQCG